MNIRALLVVLMGLEPRLVVLPYPNCHNSTKCHLFQNVASVISGVTKVHMYVEKLWLRDGKKTIVNSKSLPLSAGAILSTTSSTDPSILARSPQTIVYR